MNLEERYNRIGNTTHVVFPDDKTIHVIEDIKHIDDMLLIETSSGLLFNDMDVFTVHEMVDVENKIKELLK